jgi:hypothetical protein
VAIYRPPKARWPLAAAVGAVAALCGLLIGLAIGSKDPDPQVAAQEVRAALSAASGSVEIAVIEYEEAVGPEGVESETEYEGARDALASSRARYEEVRPALDVLVPSATDALDELYERCSGLLEDAVPEQDFGACAEALTTALEGEA